MNSRRLIALVAVVAGVTITTPTPATAQPHHLAAREESGRVIVRTAGGDITVVDTLTQAARVGTVISVSHSLPVEPAVIDPTDISAREPLRADQWNISMVKAPSAWSRTRGESQVVAVIDTGIDPNHPDVAEQLVDGYDAVYDAPMPVVTSRDGTGHGTFVAGTIAAAINGIGGVGVAPEALLMPVRVFDDRGLGRSAWVAAGIEWAIAHGATVMNLSLTINGSDPAVSAAIMHARQAGVVVVAAAGNYQQAGNPILTPASYPGVIGVGATNSRRTITTFSETGSQIDLVAPGCQVPGPVQPDTWGYNCGTSFSAPLVAGAAALLAALPNADRVRVEQALLQSGADLGAPGRDDTYGHGMLDITAALDAFDRLTGTLDDPEPPVLPYDIPGEVSGVVVIPRFRGGDVSWNAPSNDGGTPITRYVVTLLGGYTRVCVTRELHCRISGLAPGTVEYVSVAAENAVGIGPNPYYTQRLVVPVVPPSGPRQVRASLGARGVVVSWERPTDSGGDINLLYTATTYPGGRACVARNALRCTIAGLRAGVTYRLTVTAANSAGRSRPSTVTLRIRHTPRR